MQSTTGSFNPCPHCNGTSMCQFAIRKIYDVVSTLPPEAFMSCTTCGKGNSVFAKKTEGWFPRIMGVPYTWPKDESLQPPICSVCGGKGFIKAE